jgi:hypothetical protein
MSPAAETSRIWSSGFYIEKPKDRPDVDRLVCEVQFLRAAIIGLLVGILLGGVAHRAWAPQPGQRYQLRLSLEAISTQPATAPGGGTEERNRLAKDSRP